MEHIEFNHEMYNFRDKPRANLNNIRYMLSRTQMIFKWTGLPDTIPERMLELYLQLFGFAVFAEVDGKLYAFRSGLGGAPDVYYQPTLAVIANPALNYSASLRIGEDCVLVNGDGTRTGLLPMFRKYSTALVENDISFDIATKNARISSVMSAPDTRTKKAAEKYLQDVEDGALGVIAEEPMLDGIRVQPAAASGAHSITDLIEYHQYIKASWYNDLGINANYNLKREAINGNEAQLNFDALLPLIDDMLRERQEGAERINAMFGTTIKVELASAWAMEQQAVEQALTGDQSEELEPAAAEDPAQPAETEAQPAEPDTQPAEIQSEEPEPDEQPAEPEETEQDAAEPAPAEDLTEAVESLTEVLEDLTEAVEVKEGGESDEAETADPDDQ